MEPVEKVFEINNVGDLTQSTARFLGNIPDEYSLTMKKGYIENMITVQLRYIQKTNDEIGYNKPKTKTFNFV